MEETGNRKVTNSAIGSWSGYIFQGLCAIYVVLRYLHEELTDEAKKEEYKDYMFYLDSFDDFSIHRGDNVAVSLHQCKVYKDNTGFRNDQEQLLEQKAFLLDQAICDDCTKLYFHANHVINELEGVIQYKYADDDLAYGPEKISHGIRDLVGEILIKSQQPRPKDRVCNALYRFIDSHVQRIHQTYLNGKQKLCDMARTEECAVPFESVRAILYEDDLKYCSGDEFWIMAKFTFLNTINDIVSEFETPEDWEGMNSESVLKLVDSIGGMDEGTFQGLMKRVVPGEKKEIDMQTVMNLANSSIVNGLVTVVGRSIIKISDRLDWNERGKHETPAVFSQSTKRSICKAIYEQRNNLDCLWEYDWLVHDKVLEKVDNCLDAIPDITNVEEHGDTDNIFMEKKIGLLNVMDFNEGDYD